MKSAPPLSKSKRKRLRVKSDPGRPQLNVGSIASWWAGVARDDDKIDLQDLCSLLGVRPEFKEKLAFKTTPDRRLEIDIARYPESLPVAIGHAVVRFCTVAWMERILECELNRTADEVFMLNSIVDSEHFDTLSPAG